MKDIDKNYLESLANSSLTEREENDGLFPSLLRLLGNINQMITIEELEDIIIGRRLKWFTEKKDLLKQYANLNPIECAFRFIYLDHLHIDPKDLEVIRVNPKKMIVRSYNWCPYLEACKRMGLDTKKTCGGINDYAFQVMIKLIDPKLKFSRNYDRIRPYSEFCEEYIELIE